MASDAVEAIQAWYAARCDGDWEHQYGVVLETLDNPGWTLRVDLVGTPLQGVEAAREEIEHTDGDWLQFWSDGERFIGAAGSRNLAELLAAFARFASSS